LSAGEQAYEFGPFYLLFVPIVIAAVRHGVDGACFGLAVARFSVIGSSSGASAAAYRF
jgi:hypothetical protein